MTPNDKPKVVDLDQYKQAARARAAKAAARQKAAARPPANGAREPFLGSRPRAGLLLALILGLTLALWLGPRLLHG